MREMTPRMIRVEPTEEMFTPNNHLDYLKNDKYHHSDKGCDIEMREVIGKVYNTKRKSINIRVMKYCKTHKIMCSKTGWEEGFYQGTDSVELINHNYCRSCGADIGKRCKFCSKCLKERGIKQQKQRLIKAKLDRAKKKLLMKSV